LTDIFSGDLPVKAIVTRPPWVDRCRVVPFDHQIVGVERMRQQPYFLLADEMGAGKSKQSIDLAQVLHVYDKSIDRVIVITEASIRPVWFDPEFGELAKHLWKGLPSNVTEYHQKLRTWDWEPAPVAEGLQWLVTNYDYVINEDRLDELSEWANKRTLLILDESSAIKNHKAVRTKACMRLRRKCGRVLLLNGTPIANSPADMLSQGNMMSPDILECGGITHFRARYAVMGGYVAEVKRGNRVFKVATQVIKWQHIDDLQRRFAPYVLRRLKKDCMDLPEKLPPVTLTVPLSAKSWKLYREMRDEMVVWLGTGASSAQQAMGKAIRLRQITSGFLGGIEEMEGLLDFSGRENENLPEWMLPIEPVEPITLKAPQRIQEVGTEKLDMFIDWFKVRLEEDAAFKVIVWCAFLPELHRLMNRMREEFQNVRVEGLYGGQKKDERERALRLLDPRTTCAGPAIVAGTIGTGGKGHTFTASHTVVNMSFDYSLEKYLQASDRVHRHSQVHPVSYFDIAATGPTGQKTIDHIIIRSRYSKEDIATMTTSAWVQALREE